ncbi:FecR domain-containing protein [Rudanella lutea]|uniref:FecR domain-containing protein n=1 Tax=Rudanella lutea TaxID=451374 RepID=UPI0003708F00|nr:FecR domain-containing protein [Rudanella lutea]
MNDNTLWPLLARYLANEATSDERQSVEKWLATSDANRRLFERVQQQYRTADTFSTLPESDPSAVWERHIAPRLSETDAPVVRPLRTGWLSRTWRVAAAVVVLCLSVYGLYEFIQSQTNAQVAQTPVGKRTLLTLPDGSRVWLNADSRLEYPKTFDGSLREVRLVGEAFFDVTHNPRQPFVIRLATASIRVLGTSFNVRAYPGEQTVKTTVVTGRVAFVPNRKSAMARSQPSDTLFITPNRHVIQQVETMAVAEETVVAQKEAAWKDNQLVFDQTPMSEVARTLERWYGVTVTLERPDLANCPLTATFEGQSLTEVMDLLSRTGRFRYKLNNNELTIGGQGCE